MNSPVLFGLAFAFLFSAGTNAATVTIKNNCRVPIWPATQIGGGSQLSTTGFRLAVGATRKITVNPPWNGRFWARTHCKTEAGKFTCGTGDCGTGKIPCNGLGGKPPATLVEINFATNGGQDFYDVSNVDGFNIPATVAPSGGKRKGDCKTSKCTANINRACPPELKVKQGNNVIGCKSACVAFGNPKYCCTGPNDKPETCPATNYSKFFSAKCPEAYSYAYDDKKGTFTCFGGPDYLITFC